MSEIKIDGDRIQQSFMDGSEVFEVWIDGCIIRFDKLYRTGFLSITGGGGQLPIDLTDMNDIVFAGVRFKGTSSVTGSVSRDTGWIAVCSTTYSNNSCGGSTNVIQSPGTAPFGCQYGSMTHVIGYTRALLIEDVSGMPQASVWVAGYGPGTAIQPTITSPILSPRSTVSHSGSSNRQSGGNYDMYGIQGRSISFFDRVCNSAGNPATIQYGGGLSGEHTFWLSNNSLSPSGAGPLAVRISDVYNGPEDNLDDWFYGITFPHLAFTAGEMNNVTVQDVIGSRNVDIEFFIIYR